MSVGSLKHSLENHNGEDEVHAPGCGRPGPLSCPPTSPVSLPCFEHPSFSTSWRGLDFESCSFFYLECLPSFLCPTNSRSLRKDSKVHLNMYLLPDASPTFPKATSTVAKVSTEVGTSLFRVSFLGHISASSFRLEASWEQQLNHNPSSSCPWWGLAHSRCPRDA